MRDDDQLPRELDRAISMLREEPAVRPEWVAAILDRAAAQRTDDVPVVAPRAAWALGPFAAIAAGLFCVAIGAGGMYVALGGRAHRTSPLPSQTPMIATAADPTKAPVHFAIVAPGAVSVHLVGDFNAWNPAALPMRRLGNGETWEVEIGLSPGRYTYAFVVDGRLARDPGAAQSASDDFGVPSSVLLVKGNGT